MQKRFAALLCTLALGLGLLTLPASASTSLFFLSINDTLPNQSAQTTPIQSGGWIYVPANIFSSRVTGVNLGVYYGLTNNDTSLVLYNLSGKNMTFDLQSGTATAVGSNPPVPSKVVRQNGVYYVPAYAVCQYFGLTYSYLSTDYGPLLRIKDGNAVLSDSMFVSSAGSMMRSRWASAQPAAPAVTPAAPAAPAAPSTSNPASKPSAAAKPSTAKPSASKPSTKPSTKPSASTASAEAAETVPEPVKAPVFPLTVGLRVSSGGNLPTLLNTLSRQGVRAVVFFPSDQVEALADSLRQAAGQGHRIGLVPTGDTPEARLESVRDGDAAVSRLIRQEVWFVLNADKEITDAGYVGWSPGLSLNASGGTNSLYDTIVEKGAGRTTALQVLAGDGLPAAVLSGVLQKLSGDGDSFLTSKETWF